MESQAGATNEEIREDRRWRADGLTAPVFKNEDDEGWVRVDGATVRVDLLLVEDEDDPHATFAAHRDGEHLARIRVDVGFKLSQQSAAAWIASGYAEP